jgi:hypothetical protein
VPPSCEDELILQHITIEKSMWAFKVWAGRGTCDCTPARPSCQAFLFFFHLSQQTKSPLPARSARYAEAWKAKHPKIKAHAIDGDFHQYVLDTMGDGAASNGFFGRVGHFSFCWIEKLHLKRNLN